MENMGSANNAHIWIVLYPLHITITPPLITQSDSNREVMVPRIWKEHIQKEKVHS